MSILLALILLIVLTMIFISLIIFVIGPEMLLQPHRRTIDYYRKYTTILSPADLGLPYEQLTLRTAEGLALSCWFVKAKSDAQGTIIILHGVSECKIAGLQMAKMFHDHQYNVFLYDSRRHGDSGGTFCTYGFYEKHDTTTIIDYLLARPDLKVGRIGLLGNSMGAAVALQVAALDSRVRAVVAESGFATLRSIFDDYQKRMIMLPWHYLRNIVIKRSEHIAHFRANAVSPLNVMKDIHVPVFIIHGTADGLIKSSYSEDLYAIAHEPKQLWLIPEAQHNDIAEKGGEEYTRRILDFFRKHLHE
jgi:uncharacterized protein